MSSTWSNLYDRFKDRRYGLLFLLAPLLVIPLVICLVADIWQSLFSRRERLKLSRLSSDELAKARSKLVKNRNRTSL